MNINAKQSKCWTCQYGICVQESSLNLLRHEDIIDPNEEEREDTFGGAFDFEERHEELEHLISQERIKAICFYRPLGLENTPPIVVENVIQCNRYHKNE